jgi:CheY-like chemotaxis protein
MSERMQIAILEDNEERRHEMRDSLSDRFPQYEICFFVSACDMIDYLRTHLPRVLVIALDHDLELMPAPDGCVRDPGTGRDVADYLAGQTATCEVVIHSTNSVAAVGMQAALEETGWSTDRVLPMAGTAWIRTVWLRALRDAIVRQAEHQPVPVLSHSTPVSTVSPTP